MRLPESRLEEMEARFDEVERSLGDPALAANPDDLKRLGKEHAELRPTIESWRAYKQARSDLNEAKAMLSGAQGDERTYLLEEIATQEKTLEALGGRLGEALTPKDPNDDRDVIFEIRAGAGGDEAGLFAAELFRMYSRYAENRNWKVEVLSSNPSGVGGFKEVTFAIKGKGAYSRLKYEAGVHRVQRVPVTESSGRIHTSAVGVNVLPEAEEVDVEINPADLRIDVYRSSGPGGQSVNTTDSAVRITHKPTGLVVSMQDEKSQLQNRDKAMRVLRARLYEMQVAAQQAETAAERRAQVGTGERAEKIRTYNFPQDRVTDHRVKLTKNNIEGVLAGELDEFTAALEADEKRRKLEAGALVQG